MRGITIVMLRAFAIIDTTDRCFVQRTDICAWNHRRRNTERTSKCQQFALRADFSMNVAAAVVVAVVVAAA